VRGRGIYVYDSAGRKYMDLYSGVSVHALGHCHPEMVEAICQQVRTLQHTSTIYLTEPLVNLAEQLAQVLPGQIRSFFSAGGSEANEGAALLATLHRPKRVPGVSEWLARPHPTGHELTGLALGALTPTLSAGSHVPPPYCRGRPFGQSLGNANRCVARGDRHSHGHQP
jgi:4-aminobutyrate aminotransferase/4-aminobutyrate aminotransferase/(S)-3-amino-2-methylpropionate transaminase